MAIPTEKMGQRLRDMWALNGSIDEDITNFIDEELQVTFIYQEPMNATELHPYTGDLPFWHPLSDGSSVVVGSIKKEQRFLLRKQ